MSKRKERQEVNRKEYLSKRAPGARWMAKHKTRCKLCGVGTECNMVLTARFRGMIFP